MQDSFEPYLKLYRPDPQPDEVALAAFADWIEGSIGKSKTDLKSAVNKLKANGWKPFIDINGCPRLERWYNGPIELDRFFVNLNDFEFVRVTGMNVADKDTSIHTAVVQFQLRVKDRLTLQVIPLRDVKHQFIEDEIGEESFRRNYQPLSIELETKTLWQKQLDHLLPKPPE